MLRIKQMIVHQHVILLQPVVPGGRSVLRLFIIDAILVPISVQRYDGQILMQRKQESVIAGQLHACRLLHHRNQIVGAQVHLLFLDLIVRPDQIIGVVELHQLLSVHLTHGLAIRHLIERIVEIRLMISEENDHGRIVCLFKVMHQLFQRLV